MLNTPINNNNPDTKKQNLSTMCISKWYLLLPLFLFFAPHHTVQAQVCNPADSIAVNELRDQMRFGTVMLGTSILGWVNQGYLDTIPDPATPGLYRISKITVTGQGPAITASRVLPAGLLKDDQLSYLQELDLSGNGTDSLGGPLRPDGSISTSRLEILNLSVSDFPPLEDSIFHHLLNNLGALKEFYFNQGFQSASALTPYTLPNSATLEHLELQNNRFTGFLDVEFLAQMRFTALKFLYAGDNNFTNLNIPGSPTSLALEKLDIDNNDLTDFKPLENLVRFYPTTRWVYASNAMDSNITDQLEFNLGSNSFPNISILDFSQNGLTGNLPADFFEKLPNVEIIDLHGNNLTGNLPLPQTQVSAAPANGAFVYGGLANLERLDLSGNQLGGALRLDWFLASQLGTNGGTALLSFEVAENQFDDIRPRLAAPNAASTLGGNFPNRFTNLEELRVEGNRFTFKNLFRLRRIFNLKQQVNAVGPDHYLPQASTNVTDFSYSPQADIGIGGVRRRADLTAVRITSDEGVIEPLSSGGNNFLSNDYSWRRIDTIGLASGTPANPTFQFIGSIRQSGLLSANTLLNNVGGVAQTDPRFRVGIDAAAENAHHLQIENLDSASHAGWLYQATIRNDSFPRLLLRTVPKKLEVGPCVDDAGTPIACQTMIVQFDPAVLAGLSPAQQDSLKRESRRSSGATPIDSCLCGAIELWEISDTSSTMLEGFGKGTRNTASSSSSKPELLSADANYELEDPSNDNIPDTTNLPSSGSGNSTAKTLIAIIDSGVDYAYPALVPHLSEGPSVEDTCLTDAYWGYDFLEERNNASDNHGHGTAVAGIAAGLSEGSILPDTSSNARDIAILPLKYTDKTGKGTVFHAACALRYAADYKRINSNGDTARVRVVNASWGYYGDPCIVLENTITYAAEKCNILIVASAGNDGIPIQGAPERRHWPSNSIFDTTGTQTADPVLSVTGHDIFPDSLHPDANYGNIHVDMAAPWFERSLLAGSVDSVRGVGGTSFSTPQVARAAAYLFDKYPDASYFAVKYALMHGVDTLQHPHRNRLKSQGRLNYAKAEAIMDRVIDRTLCSNNITVNVTKINKAQDYFRLYPNPAVEAVTVELTTANPSQGYIELINLHGQVLATRTWDYGNQLVELPLNDLATGLYLIRIHTNNQTYSQKLIKQ